MANLYLFLYALIERNTETVSEIDIQDRNDFYVNEAVVFIEKNYGSKLMFEDIAKHIGLNRSYLNTLFKDQVGCSMMESTLSDGNSIIKP